MRRARAAFSRSRAAVAAALCAAVFIALPTAIASAAWHEPGAPLNVDPTHNAQSASVANVRGVPYVAWSEYSGTSGGSNRQVYVASLNGTNWQRIGGPLYGAPNLDDIRQSIANVGGVP